MSKQVPVTIYTRDWCGFCSAAKNLLSAKGVEFEEFNASKTPDVREEMIKRSGRNTFPQIFVGAEHVGGCDDLMAAEQSGTLDILLGTS